MDEAKLRRALNRRANKLAKTLLPCPKCGGAPEIDLGLLDAAYAEGEEYISCPTMVIGIPGVMDQNCGVYAFGAFAWNRRWNNG